MLGANRRIDGEGGMRELFMQPLDLSNVHVGPWGSSEGRNMKEHSSRDATAIVGKAVVIRDAERMNDVDAAARNIELRISFGPGD